MPKKEGCANVFDHHEFKRILKVISASPHTKRNTAMLYASFGMGLRVKEIASLKVEDVLDQDSQLLEVVNLKRSMTKGNKQRYAYLTNPKVRKALNEYLTERQQKEEILFNRQSPLFKSQKGGRFSPNALQQLFHRMFKSTGLIGGSSHSGRRTFATWLIESGVDIKAVSHLMGHATIAMTARYVQDNPLRLKRISEEMSYFK